MYTTNLIFLVVLVASAVGWPQPPPPPGAEDVPEECRPKPPQHGKERTVCCDMPNPISMNIDKFKTVIEECKEQIKSQRPDVMPPNHSHPPPPPPSAGGPSPPHRGPHHGPPRFIIECMEECVFNKSGLITDAKLNEEALTKLVETYAENSAWKPVALEATKHCYEKRNETTAEDGKCNPGAHEFTKCMLKQMYLNCPSDKWQDNDECKAEKELMEKCPNLTPFPPRPPMKKNEQ